MDKNKRVNLFVIIYFLVLAVIVSWPLVLFQKTFFIGDLKSIFQPTYNFLSNNLKVGDFPLWTPYIHSGFPIFAWSQGAFAYPPVLASLWLLDSFRAFNLLIILHLFLAGWFTYLFCRSLGLKSIASLIGSSSFVLSSFFTVRMEHPNILMASVWLPFALYLLEKFFKKQSIRLLALMALALAMPVLTGQPQYAIFSYLFFASYYLFKIFRRHQIIKPYFKRFLIYFVLIFTLAFGLAAVQILPLWELKNLSDRNTSLNADALYGSFPPAQTLRFFWPNFFGWSNPDNGSSGNYWGKEGSFAELNPYLGILPLILAFAALFDKKRRYLISFLWLTTLVSLGLAFGRYFFLGQIISKLPVFNSFSVPARWLYLSIFSLSILTGLGAQKLTKFNFRQSERFIYPLAIIFGLVMEFTFIYNYLLSNKRHNFSRLLNLYFDYNQNILATRRFLREPTEIINLLKNSGASLNLWQNWLILIAFLVFFIVYFLARRKIIKSTSWQIILLITIICNLIAVNFNYLPPTAIATIKDEPATAKFINSQNPTDGLFRIFTPPDNEFILTGRRSSLLLGPGLSSLYRLASIDMTGALPEKRYNQLINFLGAHDNKITSNTFQPFFLRHFLLLNILNVKYILHSNYLDQDFIKERQAFKLVFDWPDIKIYENLKVLPTAYLVQNYKVMTDDNEKILRFLKDSAFNQTREVVLEKSPKFSYNANADASLNNVKVLAYDNESIKLKVTTASQAILILSDLFYPGWQAEIDSRPTEILRANYIFRAVEVPSGNHLITFKYSPTSFKLGLYLSMFSILTVAFLILCNQPSKLANV